MASAAATIFIYMDDRNFLSRHISGIVQIYLWGLLFSIPILFAMWGYGSLGRLLLSWIQPIGFMMVVFYLNYWIFVPKLLFRHKKASFLLSNTALYALLTVIVIIYLYLAGTNVVIVEIVVFSLSMIVCFSMFTFAAMALRSIQRFSQLEYKQLQHSEELARMETERLKDQLNPHFIFNSLNNISALVELSPEKAREAISRLSFMMRHVLEQGGTQFVPLNNELKFLSDYIELMHLRYTDNLSVEVSFPPEESIEAVNVPPMLYISLVENAFKHGASSVTKSLIKVSLTVDDEVVFTVENTLLPDTKRGKLPSHGVGLSNLTRRLEIIYPGSHNLTYGPDPSNPGTYKACIKLPRNNSQPS